MGDFYLNSFHPLVTTRAGVDAASRFDLPPFIDGSIRREPDFEHPRPVITCLCRKDKFAPRLRPGDVVAYQTIKRRYQSSTPHHRLAAILSVERLFDSHDHAASWFHRERLALPNNLMVADNPPTSLDRSHRRNEFRHLPDEKWIRFWDGAYRTRARKHGRVVGCAPLFVDTSWSAPIVSQQLLTDVFGRPPGTRNPGRHPLDRLHALADRLGVELAAPLTR